VIRFALILLVCVMMSPEGERWRALVLLGPVFLLCELGRFIMMRAFGYPGRPLFDPFPDNMPPGRPMAAWKQAVVLLAGPLPGLMLALGIQAALHPPMQSWVGLLVIYLVVLNGLNLLPIVPFAGGRLLELLFFGRGPWLAASFHLLCAASLFLAAWLLEAWPYALLGGVMLLGAPARYRKAVEEKRLREEAADLPASLDEAGGRYRRELFASAVRLGQAGVTPQALASDMLRLHGRMLSPPPTRVLWALLFFLYLGGFGAGAAAMFIQVFDTAAYTRREVVDLGSGTEQFIRLYLAGKTDEADLRALRARWLAADRDVRRVTRQMLEALVKDIPEPVKEIMREADR
jgi:hypothetical protein